MANKFLSHAIIFSLSLITTAISQPQTPPPPPLKNAPCNGILLQYMYTGGWEIKPFLPVNSTEQPYRFESVLTAKNNGWERLKNWQIIVGFHNVYLVSATKAVLADGTSLPANISNGAVFAGEGSQDLKSEQETAGEIEQTWARIEIIGTQYGVGPPDVPMPSNLSLANDGYVCPAEPTKIGTRELQVCCNIDPDFKATRPPPTKFSPLQNGDITILYDITKTEESEYWATVTISNQGSLSRLDNWHLSWDWTRGEFIMSMKGAHPTIVDTGACIFGPQGRYYKSGEVDFSKVLSCDKRPVIKDLPLSKTNDTTFGLVPHCCRDGVILPPHMDATKSKSAFTMQVHKMPGDLNRTQLFPPQNFRINGTLNPDYQCGPPVRVSPTLYDDPYGLDTQWSTIATWQVVCNTTVSKVDKPKCCVSFSAFYKESVIPCNTCACGGCENNGGTNTCNATSPQLLLPSQALLVPFANRTAMAKDHWKLKKWTFPEAPLPCPDNCGVSINWHLLTDFKGRWSARMTLFNWGEELFADWSAAVELDKTAPGFKEVYSFNGTKLNGSENTIFFQGLPGGNYLLARKEPDNPSKNFPRPGAIQSVIAFTKKNIPGIINVAEGDGFPTKVYFNGEECSIPSIIPTSNAYRFGEMASVYFSFVLLIFMFV